MKKFLIDNKKFLLPGSLLAVFLGIILIGLGMFQTVTVYLDGQILETRSAAWTVGGILRSAGLQVEDEARVLPERTKWVWNQQEIKVSSAREVMIKTPEEIIELYSPEPIPANLFSEAGIILFPEDRVLVNGQVIDPDVSLGDHDALLIQLQPAIPIRVEIDGRESTIYTSRSTLGEALESAAIHISPYDWISEDLMAPVSKGMQVFIHLAVPVTVSVDGVEVTGLTAAGTVGEALQDLGIALQNLDYSLPAEVDRLPETGEISIVRVSEQVLIMTDEVAYQNETVIDPDTPLDQVTVIEPGQPGIFASRERVRFAGEREIWRDGQESWQASEARDGVLGYGSQAVVQTAVVDGQEIEYWRKISVYATSYSPCRCGLPDGACCFGSSSGLPSQKGLIAVIPSWYHSMLFQQVYVQGYGHGVIGNQCVGCARTPMHPHIDLAYSDEDYVSWHQWTTMYFLTPIPAWYPAKLP